MSKIPIQLMLKYYWEAQTIYSAHSPFVYQFMKNIMNNTGYNEKINSIEKKRNEMLASSGTIPFIEYGAGTKIGQNSALRKVSDIARNSLSGKWQCRLIYNLVSHYGLNNMLEIGTSLGISTAYLAMSNPNAKVLTLEGNPASVELANKLWHSLEIDSIFTKVGEFGSTLGEAVNEFEVIDFAFLDGNHRKEATVDYYQLLKVKASSRSIFVVDDIYWSEGMNEAWNEIISDESVAFSIDLFRMGILFFDHSIMPKQHFKLIQYKYKPWSLGVFG